jgi:ABC-type ATPase involved in cell division
LVSRPRIIGIIFKSLRMKKKLPIEQLSQLKKQSIVKLRQEYGIVLQHFRML